MEGKTQRISAEWEIERHSSNIVLVVHLKIHLTCIFYMMQIK